MLNLQDHLNNLPAFTHAAIDPATFAAELNATCSTVQMQEQPRLYQIETTSVCNLACPFCPRTFDLRKNKQRSLTEYMPLDKFLHLLDQMPWLRSIELFHFGEPFMHKDFEKYVQACSDRDIYTVVASNLLPATPEKVDAVFAAGLRFLVMDIDSLRPDKYAAMRVNGTLDRLKERVLYILNHSARPYCVAQTINVDGVPEYTWEELLAWTDGAAPDELRYKFLDSFRNGACEKQGLQGDDLCREPFYGFSVHVNGNVVPCDRDWAGENVMGNVFETPILDIWNGAKFTAFRERMRSADKPDMCRKCAEGRLFNARSQPHIQVNMFKGEALDA